MTKQITILHRMQKQAAPSFPFVTSHRKDSAEAPKFDEKQASDTRFNISVGNKG